MARLRKQTAVIEYHAGAEWWVLLPSGDIHVVNTPARALGLIQRQAGRQNPGITITNIEWRDCPAGFVPPTKGAR